MTVTAAVIVATTRVYDMPGLLALAPWHGDETLVEWQLAQVLAADVRDIEVVIPPDGDAIIPLVARDNVEPVIDTRNTGVASAIQAGVTALPRGTTDVLIVDVAQPTDHKSLRRLIDLYQGDDYLGIGAGTRTPLIVRDDVAARLRNISDEEGIRGALDGTLASWGSLEAAISSRETYERYRDALT